MKNDYNARGMLFRVHAEEVPISESCCARSAVRKCATFQVLPMRLQQLRTTTQTGMRFARVIATVLIAHARGSPSERSRALSLASFQLRPARLDQGALQRMRDLGRESAGEEDDNRQ
jgi:hypothetical protein